MASAAPEPPQRGSFEESPGTAGCHVGGPRGDRSLGFEVPPPGSCRQGAAYPDTRPGGSSKALRGGEPTGPRPHRCPGGGAPAPTGGAGGRDGRRPSAGAGARGGGPREVVLGLLLGAQVSSTARRLLAAAPPPCPLRPGPLCGLCPPRPRPGLLPLSLSASPRASGGARSRGAPGKMAAVAGGGSGEGGAGLGGAAGSGSALRGPGPSGGASEDARGPAPSALHPEEVAARLQRMHRELSNRRKILVKNLPQDSNCQVQG